MKRKILLNEFNEFSFIIIRLFSGNVFFFTILMMQRLLRLFFFPVVKIKILEGHNENRGKSDTDKYAQLNTNDWAT